MNFNNIIKIINITTILFLFALSSCNISPSVTAIEGSTSTYEPPTITQIINPTPTRPSIPTLTSNERIFRVKEWLATNAGCKLPCWWSIQPGKATWNSVNEFLENIGAKSSTYQENALIFHEAGGFDFDQDHVYNRIAFLEKDEVIASIIVRGFGLNDSPNFKNAWVSYSPERVIAEYGVPSRVWVYSNSSVHEGSPGTTVPYSLWIFYDHLGILFRYSGLLKYQTIYKMCPTFGENGDLLDEVNIYLQSPGTNTSLEVLTDLKSFGTKPISLEEVAGISMNDFYDLFTKPGIESCFETPVTAWPPN